jgi:hypothetical protein
MRRAYSLLEEMRREGIRCIVAGGAARDWFITKRPINDIDVFFIPKDIYNPHREIIEVLGKINPITWIYEKHPLNQRNDGYRSDQFKVRTLILNEQKVQFIACLANTLEQYIDAFDFGLCKIAFDGRFYLNEDFLTDMSKGELSIREKKISTIMGSTNIQSSRIEKMKTLFPSYQYRGIIDSDKIEGATIKPIEPDEIPF